VVIERGGLCVASLSQNLKIYPDYVWFTACFTGATEITDPNLIKSPKWILQLFQENHKSNRFTIKLKGQKALFNYSFQC